jgi:hypothetical protein
MKEILLSSVLVMTLVLTGCDDDTDNNQNLDTTSTTTSSIFTDVGDLNVTEGSKSVAIFKPQDATMRYSYRITGGADASFFVIDGNALNFKSAQSYQEGESNKFVVEVTATNDTLGKSASPTTFHINIVPQATIVANPNDNDTTPPVITTASSHTIKANETITLSATDASSVTFSENSNMFTISGDILTPEFQTGTETVLVTATDAAGNSTDKNITVTISAVTTPDPTQRTATTPYIASDVVDFKGGKWLMIKGSAGGDDDIMDGNTTLYAYRQTWSDAKAICETLTLDGGGWHLPKRDEAKVLIDDFVALDADKTGTIKYTGELNSTIVAPASDVASAVIWTDDGAGEGIYFGGKEFNYTNTDENQTFSFTCTK